MVNYLLPPAIDDERFRAFLQSILGELEAIDLGVLEVWDFDNVHSSVLPHLAEELNVMGYRGWLLADSEAQKRELLKLAIELHKHAGTPYSIERSLKAVGFLAAVVIENPVRVFRYDGLFNYDGSIVAIGLNNYLTYDGQGLVDSVFDYNGLFNYDGFKTYGENQFGFLYNGRFNYDGLASGSRLPYSFEVDLNIGDKALTTANIDLITRLIEEWKNARSHLLDIFFSSTPAANINISDALELSLTTNLLYDPMAANLYNGSLLYNGAEVYNSRPFVKYDGRFFYDGFISGAIETL